VGRNEQPPEVASRFVTTQWNVVLNAGRTTTTESRDALQELCRAYWYPLYAFVRRRGHDADEARDLTQEFFGQLLAKNYLQAADPAKGRFRTFLLTVMERFLVNEWARAHRQKRGGGCVFLSLNEAEAEARYKLEPVDGTTPEILYERKWALAVLQQAMDNLRIECVASGRRELFEAVKSVLAGESGLAPYEAIATRLGMSEGAVKTTVHRWRRRYGDWVRSEVARTVATPGEVEEELRHLLRILTT
jgi:RNA polymerase sigma factor (sigma-70 family)